MASRKTRRQKIALQERNQRKEEIEKLENEKNDILKKQEEIHTKYQSAKKVMNLRLFKSFFKLIYPYCLLSLGVQIPVLFFHGGFPFVIDNHTYYKEKSLNINSEGEVNYQENYVTNYWMDDNFFPNKLTITSPWTENEDGQKSRTIREYKITYSDEIADAILAKNYESLELMLNDCSSEIFETTNNTYFVDNDYHVEGELGTIDKSFSIKVPETTNDNVFVTNFEIVLYILISIIILKCRKFRFTKVLKDIKNSYNDNKEDYKITIDDLNRKIDDIDQKILTIKRKGV